MTDPHLPPQPPQDGDGKILGMPVLVASGIGGAIVAALLFFLLTQVWHIFSSARHSEASRPDIPVAAAVITEDWILGNWEIGDGCGAWYRYQNFRREGGQIAHYASQTSTETLTPGGWEITGFDPNTLTWTGPGWTLRASGANLVVQHDEACTWTRIAGGAVGAPSGGAGADSVIGRINAISAKYYDEPAFFDELRGFFVPAYDQNGSGDFDTAEEVNSIPCEVYVALHQRMARDSESSGLVWTEGFAPNFNYVGEGLGFNASVREVAYRKMLSCGVPDAN